MIAGKKPGINPFSFLLVILAIMTLAAALYSCGSSTDSGLYNGTGNENENGNGTEEPAPDEVWIIDRSFNPVNREVETGTTVRWENKSNEIHTVTSGSNRDHDGLFDSGNIAPGGTFSYTFEDPGTYDYFCVPHPGMNASITVIDPE